MPKMVTEPYGSGDQSWLASAHGLRDAITCTLNPEDFSTQTTAGVIASGTPVDYTDPGALKPFSDTAGAKLGFLLFDQAATAGTIPVAVLIHGHVHAEKVPGDFSEPATATAPSITFVKGAAN